MFLFKKFRIIELLEKFEINIYEEHEKVLEEEAKKNNKKIDNNCNKEKKEAIVFKKKIKVDSIVAKAFSYYIFLLFFRWSVVKL
jgi:mannose-1-phosphate guanylyltransferase